jgi:hypothetical protein
LEQYIKEKENDSKKSSLYSSKEIQPFLKKNSSTELEGSVFVQTLTLEKEDFKI